MPTPALKLAIQPPLRDRVVQAPNQKSTASAPVWPDCANPERGGPRPRIYASIRLFR
jgi:hypothetical protein